MILSTQSQIKIFLLLSERKQTSEDMKKDSTWAKILDSRKNV